MTPPRKTTGSIDVTGNFFQRGKKASTAQRVVTAKEAISSSSSSSQKGSSTVAPAKKRPAKHVDQEDHEEGASDEIDDGDYSDEEQVSDHHDYQDEATSEEELDEHRLIDDEIQSDDSDLVVTELPHLEKVTIPRKSASISGSGSGGAIKKVETVKTTTKTAKTAKGTRTRGKKNIEVAANVGDIHVGCKLG